MEGGICYVFVREYHIIIKVATRLVPEGIIQGRTYDKKTKQNDFGSQNLELIRAFLKFVQRTRDNCQCTGIRLILYARMSTSNSVHNSSC